jgi:hypothetical protein
MMTRLELWMSAALGAASLVACGGAPKPETRLASSEGAIRGAQEAGAQGVPEATLHLKLAQEQRERAIQLVNSGDNHRAAMLLARAEADAELAVALARAAHAQAEAQKAAEGVQDLERKANQ